MTAPRSPFLHEARYRGAKVAAVSPDYAEYVKLAERLPARAARTQRLPGDDSRGYEEF